jgi:hypothetical protein
MNEIRLWRNLSLDSVAASIWSNVAQGVPALQGEELVTTAKPTISAGAAHRFEHDIQ